MHIKREMVTEHCNECFPPGRQSHAHIHSCSRLYNGSNEAMRSKGGSRPLIARLSLVIIRIADFWAATLLTESQSLLLT